MKLQVEVTSGTAGQIPVLGNFKAGETKVVTDEQLAEFEAKMGFKLVSGAFGGESRCVVTVLSNNEEKDEEA